MAVGEIGRTAKAFQTYSHGMGKSCMGTPLWGTLENKTLNSSKSMGNKIRIKERHRSSLNQLYHQGLMGSYTQDLLGLSALVISAHMHALLLFAPKSSACQGPSSYGCLQLGIS